MIYLRDERADDVHFLRELYGSIREQELAPVPWSDAQKRAFVDQQFAAQCTHYRTNYPGAHFSIICDDDVRVGRLYLHEREQEFRIMDLAIVAEHRRRGIGSAVVSRVLERAAATGKAVTIHVEQFNPARALYQRLGFVERQLNGIYILMEKPAQPTREHQPNTAS